MRDTHFIAKQLKLIGKLSELKGDNPFKIRSYYAGAKSIEALPPDLGEMIASGDINQIKGIGAAISQKIHDLYHTGTCPLLDRLQTEIPEGIQEMALIKGLGTAKIKAVWKELDITNTGDLLYACHENRLVDLKGFGEKTQEKIRETLEYYISQQDFHHYSRAYPLALEIILGLKKNNGQGHKLSLTGEIRRKIPVISGIDILAEVESGPDIKDWFLSRKDFEKESEEAQNLQYRHIDSSIPVNIHLVENHFYTELFKRTGSEEHVKAVLKEEKQYANEEEIYTTAKLQYIEPELRENLGEIELARGLKIPNLLTLSDIRGIIHAHSTYSDGIHSLEEMAKACMDKGWEYLGITDHSRSAVYANGLNAHRVRIQQEEIDRLNHALAPFKIFKGIESDILSDGRLDYEDEVLATFDFVIASVHSQLTMPEEKATTRLINAIENPYTTLLGHPTGRLLMMRKGYPIDHRRVIDACAANHVMIEINANPFRLDLDWTWVSYALEKGVMLSVNPDAHRINGLDDVFWGIEVGRKGMLTKERTLNALSLAAVTDIFQRKKERVHS